MATPRAPRVTVAVPTRNRAALLRDALASTLAQTLDDLEVVVSDNASTDETAEVVASFADPRVTYAPLAEDVGLHGNLNRCLGLGSAPYLAILQDDDVMLPANLERKVAALEERPEAVLAHGAFRFVDEEGRVLSEAVDWWKSDADVESGPEFVRGMLERGVRVDMSSWLLRRDLVGGTVFDPADGLATDFGFLLRLGLSGDVVYLSEVLTAVRRHGASFSVGGASIVLEGGHYAPSFAYTLGCRDVARRFLAAHGAELPEPASLDLASRRWARRELASVVRLQAGDEPAPRRTLELARRAAAADPRVLLTRKLLLTLGWTLIGGRGRRLARRVAPSLAGRGVRARSSGA